MRLRQLDLLAIGKRAITNRLKELERAKRRKTTTAGKLSATADTGVKRTLAGTLQETETVKPTLARSNDGSAIGIPARPNLIQNGSFEYFQNGGSAVPHAWNTAFEVVAAVDSLSGLTTAVDGQYVLDLLGSPTSDLSASLGHLAGYPAGAWAFSFYARAKNSNGVNLTASLDLAGGTVIPSQMFKWDAALGDWQPESFVGLGEDWQRFYVSFLVTEIEDHTFGLIFEGDEQLQLDGLKLEFEEGSTSFIQPTSFVADSFSAATIVRSLKAENIVAGTLKVGGSTSEAPMIEVYNGSDVLIARMGDVAGGFPGLEVFGTAGVKAQSSGSIEGGAVSIRDDGIEVEARNDNVFDPSRALKFVNAARDVFSGLWAALYNTGSNVANAKWWLQALGSNNTVEISLLDNADNTVSAVDIRAVRDSFLMSPQFLVRSFGEANVNESTNVIIGVGTIGATASVQANATWNGTTATTELLLDANTHKVNGFTKTWPAVNGTVAHGAGDVSGSTTGSASGANHTHTVLASNDPGAVADVLLKTGASGLLKLALLTLTGTLTGVGAAFSSAISAASASLSGALSAASATITGTLSAATGTFTSGLSAGTGTFTGLLSAATFSLGGKALTVSNAGNLVTGAGTLGVGIGGSDTAAAHTHPINTTNSGANSQIVATTSNGDIVAGRMLTAAKGAKVNNGTSFPASPLDGQEFFRTDVGLWFTYIGSVSRWMSSAQPVTFMDVREFQPYAPGGYTSGTPKPVLVGHIDSKAFSIQMLTTSYLDLTNNAAADSASNYWNCYAEIAQNGGAVIATLGNSNETLGSAATTKLHTGVGGGRSSPFSLSAATDVSASTLGGKVTIWVEKIGSPTSTLTVRGVFNYVLWSV